jgi:peptidoglycan/LPS O-acetylase OafA/YrhL
MRSGAGGTARVAALDGLRGLTIVLVVVAHGWLIWPIDELMSIEVVRGVFVGGTVTVFFVIGAYVVTRGLCADLDRGTFDPLRFYLRRVVRLGAQLSVVCVAVLALDQWDSTVTEQDRTLPSILHVLTYTWNTYLEVDPLLARSDLGHLWYLSVQQQAYLALPLFLVLLAWSRKAAMVALAAGIVVVIVLRYRLFGDVGYWPASLRTETRADGLLLGVLIGIALPTAPAGRPWARWLFTGSLALMLALIAISGEVGDFQYLRWWGIAVMVVSGLLVVAIVSHPGDGMIRALTMAPLVRLGKASYSIYLWHYPLFWFMSRHTPEWHWATRTVTALLILTVVVVVMERFVEEPVRRLLAGSDVFRLRAAPVPAATG